jgi:drug/metabolite transporter (DMT)-like permease
VAILLALSAAVMYGVADYVGGRASRFSPAIVVTLAAEVVMFTGVLIALLVLGDPYPGVEALLWGGLAGLAGVVGVLCLYHALANGVMTVVAPITAVVAAILPVIVGLALGERPGTLALVGVVVAVAAVALVSGAIGVPHVPTPTRLVVVSLVAGAAFGGLFVFLDQAPDDSGIWPLLGSRAASLPVLAVVASLRGVLARPERRVIWPGVAIGALTLGANVSYLEATRRGLLSIVAVVVSMYPASTVVLATVLDGERLRRPQVAGLALTGGALVLVTLGR